MKKLLYPHAEELEAARREKLPNVYEEPDFIGNAPNYDKFAGWDVERVLVWLNID